MSLAQGANSVTYISRHGKRRGARARLLLTLYSPFVDDLSLPSSLDQQADSTLKQRRMARERAAHLRRGVSCWASGVRGNLPGDHSSLL